MVGCSSLDKGIGGGKIKKRITLLVTALMLALAMSFGEAATAFADNSHAGGSGHFKGSATPCEKGSNNPNCPPFGH